MLSWAVSWREGRKFVYTREGSWAGISPLNTRAADLGSWRLSAYQRAGNTCIFIALPNWYNFYQCNYNNYYIYACLLFNSALTICTVQDRCKLSLYKGTPFIYIHDPCLQATLLSARHVVGLLHVFTFSNVLVWHAFYCTCLMSYFPRYANPRHGFLFNSRYY